MQRTLPSQIEASTSPVPAPVSRRLVLRVLPGIAAAAVAGIALTGCGGDDDDDDDDDD